MAQSNWNNLGGLSGSASSLIDNLGSVTGIGVNWGPSSSGFNAATQEDQTDQFSGEDGNLMAGYLDQYNAVQGLATVTGLIPGSSHDVYVYTLASVAATPISTARVR